ncbi:efflux RND transporter periplasmic adaptor subunit [Spirochaeta isovalerica]|uniref:Membrane fusion protein (Multidrug efflux system) n=1 Tax=Spirochaeta isovalerica TaxID=150 RepID=A0A841R5U7_9SPIO|nr:efflux RND transporter periplasmic adaptor subunit [Spirochaeta isovalerica]MBB6480574.1 membrane fusion protein (multidrug efflux system) [Spirochaeta isovalerica]
MRIRIQLSIVMVLVLTGIIFFTWKSGNREQEQMIEEIKVPVVTMNPRSGTLEKRISFRSFVESDHTVAVYPQAVGVLQSVPVEEGQRVEAGQLIAVLENESLLLNLQQAQSALNLARDDMNRYKTMYEKSLISEQQFQTVETNYKATESRYELARVQYEYSRVKSPIEGIVQRVNVEPGILVSSQVNLMSIATRDSKIIKADIPEKYYEYFQKKGNLAVEVYRSGDKEKIYRGKIEYVSPFISPGTMKFQVTVKLEDSGQLVPGMYMEVSFILDKRDDQISLPYSALTRKGQLWYVDDENLVHSLTPGEIFNGDEWFAISGDLADKAFIVEGQHFLSEGQEVRVIGGSAN